MKCIDMKTPKTQNLEHGNPEIPKISKNWILKTQIRREVGEKKKMHFPPKNTFIKSTPGDCVGRQLAESGFWDIWEHGFDRFWYVEHYRNRVLHINHQVDHTRYSIDYI